MHDYDCTLCYIWVAVCVGELCNFAAYAFAPVFCGCILVTSTIVCIVMEQEIIGIQAQLWNIGHSGHTTRSALCHFHCTALALLPQRPTQLLWFPFLFFYYTLVLSMCIFFCFIQDADRYSLLSIRNVRSTGSFRSDHKENSTFDLSILMSC